MKSSAFVTLSLLILLGSVSACWEKDPVSPGEKSSEFQTVPERYPVAPGLVDEASGLADSRTITGYLWTHENAGRPAELFLISHNGKDVRRYPVPGTSNNDWEDIAVGGGPEKGVSYLYVGDIGSNDIKANYSSHTIYRMPELGNLDSNFMPDKIARITYRYPEGQPDAETLLHDPVTNDLFIVTKELDKANLYRLPFPQSTDGVITAELVGKIPALLLATGGDISSDGQEILIRTYTHIYYWRRKAGESIGQTLLRAANKPVPYAIEPQGEAVCFDREMKGYYTLSEKRHAAGVALQYFGRK